MEFYIWVDLLPKLLLAISVFDIRSSHLFFIMFARILARSTALPRHMIQQRATLVAGPPKYRIPFTEKLLLGGTMIIGVCTPGAWILYNIENYKNGE